MKYFCPNTSSYRTKPANWGVIVDYRRWSIRPILEGRRWIADNGCFTDNWDRAKWLSWLHDMKRYNSTCEFVTMPDIVGSHEKTLHKYALYYKAVSSMGYKTAFVCQDGCTPQQIPFANAIFIGGTTKFKMGSEARECIQEGRRRGYKVHIGRVNSAKRYAYFMLQGADSFDGTSYCFAPDKVTKEIEAYMRCEPLFYLKEKA